jgi:hypothetical protein
MFSPRSTVRFAAAAFAVMLSAVSLATAIVPGSPGILA